MDSGLNLGEVLDLKSGLASGEILPPSKLDIHEIIYIIDRLLVVEVCVWNKRNQSTIQYLWYNGIGLVPALLTCLYLHDTDVIDCPILKAFVTILMKRAILVRQELIDSALCFVCLK